MKPFLLLLILLALNVCHASAQRQADLRKFVKTPDVAAGAIIDIDSMSAIAGRKFIKIANDIHSKTHKDIEAFFNDFKTNDDNLENNTYPQKLDLKNISIQYTGYNTQYGWLGTTMDTVFRTTSLTALVLIPAFDQYHKGQAVNTICFKMILEIDTEAILKTNKEYKHEEKITALKQINIDP